MTTLGPGKPYPLGATPDDQGVNFALFSAHATRVELCVFQSPEAPREDERVRMLCSGDIWHVYAIGGGIVGAATVVGSFIGSLASIAVVILNYVKRGDARGI
jgi:hypothetical protein